MPGTTTAKAGATITRRLPVSTARLHSARRSLHDSLNLALDKVPEGVDNIGHATFRLRTAIRPVPAHLRLRM